MLITTDKGQTGTKAVVDGDKIKCFHAEEVTEVMKAAHEMRKMRENGFTDLRHFRQILILPPLAYMRALQKYPEINGDRQQRKIAWKKVYCDPEFEFYRTVNGGV